MKSAGACKTPSPSRRQSHTKARHCLVGFSQLHLAMYEKKNACCCVHACTCMCMRGWATFCRLVRASMSMSKVSGQSGSQSVSICERVWGTDSHVSLWMCQTLYVYVGEKERDREVVWCLDRSQAVLRQPCSLGAL